MRAASFLIVYAALMLQWNLKCALGRTQGLCLDKASSEVSAAFKANGARKCRQAASAKPAEEAAMGAWGAHFSEHGGLCQPRQICLNPLHKAVCNLLLLALVLCHTEPLQMGGSRAL